MKPHLHFLVCLLAFLSGCNTAPTPINETPNALATGFSYSLTEAGAKTPTPISLTDNAISTPPLDGLSGSPEMTVVFLDEFNAALATGWDWQNENPKTWSLTEYPGNLLILAESGYINLGNATNILLRNAPEGDFAAETKLNFLPKRSDQFAGIVLLESEKEYIQAGLEYCSPAMGCVRNGFYVDVYQNGKLTLPRNILEYSEESIFISVAVSKGFIEISTSRNGEVWYRTFSQPLEFKPAKVGLFAGQNSRSTSQPATFDYFKISVP